ncbi:MAG TPA: RimK/LysX family protein [Bdellovibrionales bacterium]|jgi:hypothetical protein|nr:RimK/LysX family protein [Bdellovibrionales bacterium]
MTESRILIGWREWIALPELKLPVIKAKVDTGARTSSLHAFEVETLTEHGHLMVRFSVHPVQGRKDIVVVCKARVVDHRYVSDSGGHRERRYVIETPIEIGGRVFPIEITLANRETMSHRMLIGRSAMKTLMIDPAHSYLLGRPKKIVGAYRKLDRRKAKRRKKGST